MSHIQSAAQKEWPFEVGQTAFAAVRFDHPRIPGSAMWLLKIVETGEILEAGTAGINNESRPKMVQDLEYLLARFHKGDRASFRNSWGLPPIEPSPR